MAHSPVVIMSANEPKPLEEFDGTVLVGPSPLLWVADRHKRSLDVAELNELHEDFMHAMNRLMDFAKVFSLGEPYLETLRKQPVRRRPARKDRPETKAPKLPPQ